MSDDKQKQQGVENIENPEKIKIEDLFKEKNRDLLKNNLGAGYDVISKNIEKLQKNMTTPGIDFSFMKDENAIEHTINIKKIPLLFLQLYLMSKLERGAAKFEIKDNTLRIGEELTSFSVFHEVKTLLSDKVDVSFGRVILGDVNELIPPLTKPLEVSDCLAFIDSNISEVKIKITGTKSPEVHILRCPNIKNLEIEGTIHNLYLEYPSDELIKNVQELRVAGKIKNIHIVTKGIQQVLDQVFESTKNTIIKKKLPESGVKVIEILSNMEELLKIAEGKIENNKIVRDVKQLIEEKKSLETLLKSAEGQNRIFNGIQYISFIMRELLNPKDEGEVSPNIKEKCSEIKSIIDTIHLFSDYESGLYTGGTPESFGYMGAKYALPDTAMFDKRGNPITQKIDDYLNNPLYKLRQKLKNSIYTASDITLKNEEGEDIENEALVIKAKLLKALWEENENNYMKSEEKPHIFLTMYKIAEEFERSGIREIIYNLEENKQSIISVLDVINKLKDKVGEKED